jgi:hypothetical protein
VSARAVSAGSQPAIDVSCDFEPCYETERLFLDWKSQARENLAARGWLSIQIGSVIGDYCPKHAAGVQS